MTYAASLLNILNVILNIFNIYSFLAGVILNVNIWFYLDNQETLLKRAHSVYLIKSVALSKGVLSLFPSPLEKWTLSEVHGIIKTVRIDVELMPLDSHLDFSLYLLSFSCIRNGAHEDRPQPSLRPAKPVVCPSYEIGHERTPCFKKIVILHVLESVGKCMVAACFQERLLTQQTAELRDVFMGRTV